MEEDENKEVGSKPTKTPDDNKGKEPEVKETGTKEVKEEKTFTQKELDEIIESRLAKAKKGIPSKEEMKEFNEWRDSQKTAEEKKAEAEKESLKVKQERDEAKKENFLLRKGVNPKDLDYVLFKASRMEGEFEENAEKFIKENPNFLMNYEAKPKQVDLGTTNTKTPSNEPKSLKSALQIRYNK